MTPVQDAPPQGPAASIALADCLDMTAAAPLAAELRAVRGAPISLDASGVRRVGAQCLQVLLAAQTAWAAEGVAFDVIDPSPEFSDGLALMGAAGFCVPAVQD
jgi:chemotaxis protein CheX